MRALAFAAAILVAAAPVVGEEIGSEPLVQSDHDVVILGEVHDNPAHHAFQAADIAAIDPSAVVFEMLSPATARRVVPQVRQSAEALGAVTRWDQSGWPDLEIYMPVFRATGDRPIFGGQLTRRELAPVFAPGFEPPAAMAPYGIAAPLDPAEQAEREALQAVAHCDALPEEALPAMVMAQRLRDAALAEAALAALDAHGPPVVVITGNGHARRDWGVPAALAAARPGIAVLSVAHLETAPETGAPFDLWRVTDGVDRPDPCAAFRER